MLQVPDNKLSDSHPLLKTNYIFLLILGGFVIRLIILIFAENRLDSDEATVGVMALNILEGTDFPFFFYGTTYNGGGAFEAYLGAAAFKLFGPSEIALKFCLLVIWAVTALFFGDLCRRVLSENRAFLSVLFFVVGTPFFLEWSLKARGGFAETVLFSVILLWLVYSPKYLQSKQNLISIAFGIICGIGIWTSEMLLAMVFCAGIVHIIRCGKDELKQTLKMLIFGLVIGLLPLIIYNVTHHFDNIRSSVLYKLVMNKGEGKGALSFDHLRLSTSFIFGKAYILIIAGVIVSAVRLIRNCKNLNIGHVVLIHTSLYCIAYWLSGLRYLEIPPSRVLYALYPGLAILLSYAVSFSQNTEILKRTISIVAIVVWLLSISLSTVQWISSGVPREELSWRGSWALIDGNGLYKKLVELGAEEVFSNSWTRRSLLFAMQENRYLDPGKPLLKISYLIPELPGKPVKHVAVVLHPNGHIIKEVEKVLQSNRIQYQRSKFKKLLILWGLDSSQIHLGTGLPRAVTRADWEPLPLTPDGFN